jgi:GTP pyrophosphokinase
LYHRIDFSHEDITIDELARRVKSNHPDADIDLLKRAYEFAELHHRPQKRSSGEPYIIHPLNVAATLIKLQMDLESIIGGLLHDVVEDCDVSEDEILEKFGRGIADIVIGCTKISKIKFKTKEESQAENFRKMVVAMAKDIRVIIVKLADRMHNMLTLQYVSKEKQVKKAQETLDIYVPLASRLGINSVKSELEDLCLRFLHPETYYRLAEKVSMKKHEREEYIKDCVLLVKDKFLEYAVKADVYGRPKHFYSIYKKMNNREVDFEQIQDLLAFRVIVDNITECYKCLGIIHSSFTPIPGRFKDYIAIPKVNGYQSLHTTVIGPKAERIEIQIRTYEMHEVAETGVAAHWKYKEGGGSSGAKQLNKLKWVEELMEYDRDIQKSSEFMDVVKNDLDAEGIFVFTPSGDVRELRYGAGPLDFAYAVHTQVGHTCVGAKVNGKMVSLKHKLKSGDTVEILTSKSQTPNKDWVKLVKTSKARTKIKQYLLKVDREKNLEIGTEILEKSLKEYNSSFKVLEKKNEFKKVLDSLNLKTIEELCLSIGSKRVNIKKVLELLPSIDYVEEDESKKKIDTLFNKVAGAAKKSAHKDNAVIVDGLDDIVVRMGKCCNPIPGDPITGFITRGRGITIHTMKCERVRQSDDLRKVDVAWNSAYSFRHAVAIRVITHDRPGILSRITNNINAQGVNIKGAIAKSLPDLKGSFLFEVEVKDYSEFLKVISIIEAMEEVISANRA